MTPQTTRFLAFALFGLASLIAGYTARRRGWIHEDRSKQIHFHTIVWIWSTALLLSLWRIPPRAENLWLLAIQPVIMALSAYGVIPLARWIGCTRGQVGVMAIAAGLSNNGFTLGAYLCYTLIHPAEEALAYGLAFVSIMNASMVLLIYPMARHYGTMPTNGQSLGKLILHSYIDLRAMTMYAAITGVILAVTRAPYPAFVDQLHLMDILFYLGAFGGYFGIGLRLRLGDSAAYLKQHTLLAVMKFAFMPVTAAVILWGISLTPYPLDHVARQVTRIETATPTGIILVMIANLFGLDTRMASVLWMWNTLLFVMIPLPIIIWLSG